jgi:ABC-type bacteriocin/lantibiotic exporter with double-glycine peptidase domain
MITDSSTRLRELEKIKQDLNQRLIMIVMTLLVGAFTPIFLWVLFIIMENLSPENGTALGFACIVTGAITIVVIGVVWFNKFSIWLNEYKKYKSTLRY